MSIDNFKIKSLIKKLHNIQGQGTSMVSIAIKTGANISDTNNMLTTEYGSATNIKSRVNRQSVLSAITSAQAVLKKFNKTPPNGLAVFCGFGMDPITNKEKKFNITIEPPKPLLSSFYRCDSNFHTHFLNEMIIDNDTFGFIIIDGKETVFATVNGNIKKILGSFTVSLPKKHNKGGQSAVRFSRQREEAIHNYITKVCEKTNSYFIDKNGTNVKGIIIAGSADLKTQIEKHKNLDFRLNDIILARIDIAYGGLVGLNQAISESSLVISDFKLKEEKEIIQEFLDHIVKDTKMILYGFNNIFDNLEGGIIDKIILYDNLEDYIIIDEDDKIQFVKNLDDKPYKDSFLITDYLLDNKDKFGIDIKFISDATAEGNQIIQGFGGLVAILRFPLDSEFLDDTIFDDTEYDDFI